MFTKDDAKQFIRNHYQFMLDAVSIESAHKWKMVCQSYNTAWLISHSIDVDVFKELVKEIEAVYNLCEDKLKD